MCGKISPERDGRELPMRREFKKRPEKDAQLRPRSQKGNTVDISTCHTSWDGRGAI